LIEQKSTKLKMPRKIHSRLTREERAEEFIRELSAPYKIKQSATPSTLSSVLPSLINVESSRISQFTPRLASNKINVKSFDAILELPSSASPEILGSIEFNNLVMGMDSTPVKRYLTYFNCRTFDDKDISTLPIAKKLKVYHEVEEEEEEDEEEEEEEEQLPHYSFDRKVWIIINE
jgi:hypothetical protein